MRTGWTISAAGHVALILFLLLAGAFSRAPLPPVEVAEVTLVSEEEFALLMRPETGPAASGEVTAPEAPEATAAPETPSPEERPDLPEPPRQSENAPQDSAPSAPPELTPEAEVADASPAPPAPPDSDDTAPRTGEPTPDAAPRVAPEAAPPPPLDAESAPRIAERTAPSPEAEPERVVEDTRPTAPDEATTEIVTEAETPAASDLSDSPRPRARPARLAARDPGRSFEAASTPLAAEEDMTEEAPAPAEDDAMAAAIAAAVAEAVPAAPEAAPETGDPAGPPLSQGERDAFRVAVERCWIVDPGSPAASVTLVVGMRMTRNAKPDTASIELLGAQGGDDSAVRTAFEAARRAILRCSSDGFPLPPEKYSRWAQVEMTFNPEGMRIR